MIRILYGPWFLRSAEQLPAKQRAKLGTLIALTRENPFHPKLHAKPLVGELSGLYAFRITRDWRVIFQFVDADAIQLLRVKHRRDAYR